MGASLVLAGRKLSLQELPVVVQATVEKHAGQGRVTEIEQETHRGETVYEVEVVLDGKKTEFQVSESGEYLGPEGEEDDGEETEGLEKGEEGGVPWGQLPQAVQKALHGMLPDAQAARFSRDAEDGFITYEASYEKNGRKHELELAEDGHMVEQSEEIPPSSLPSDVMAELDKKLEDAEVEQAELVVITMYELKVRIHGKKREVRILANGQFLDDDED